MLYKEDWLEAKERIEAWWHGEIIDRAAIMVTAPKMEFLPEKPEADVDYYWIDPSYVIEEFESRAQKLFYGAEALPCLWINLGAASLSAYVGCPLRFRRQSVWHDPIIDDWQHVPHVTFDPENKWWRATLQLTRVAVEAGEGKFLVGLTDLGGISDALSHLRGPQNLCLDLISRPEEVKAATKDLQTLWFRCYEELYEIIRDNNEGGSSFWMGLWSHGKTFPIQEDFSCMISSKMFKEFFLPYVQAQAKWLDHSIYHLDGPGALHHLDLLLDIPELDGIQWEPGEGARPISQRWIPVLRRIQASGKRLFCFVEADEVLTLMRALRPEGVVFRVECDTKEEALTLIQYAERWAAGRV